MLYIQTTPDGALAEISATRCKNHMLLLSTLFVGGVKVIP